MIRRTLAVLALTAAIAPFANAADSATATKFLRAYVRTLCAERAGDHEIAIAAMQPFAASEDRDVTAAAKSALGWKYTDASVSATWAFVAPSGRSVRFVVSRHERKDAVAALRECFGDAITRGPMKGTPDLHSGAATLAWFLTQDIDPVAQPRWPSPRRQ